jgi:hypothetical protein
LFKKGTDSQVYPWSLRGFSWGTFLSYRGTFSKFVWKEVWLGSHAALTTNYHRYHIHKSTWKYFFLNSNNNMCIKYIALYILNQRNSCLMLLYKTKNVTLYMTMIKLVFAEKPTAAKIYIHMFLLIVHNMRYAKFYTYKYINMNLFTSYTSMVKPL